MDECHLQTNFRTRRRCCCRLNFHRDYSTLNWWICQDLLTKRLIIPRRTHRSLTTTSQTTMVFLLCIESSVAWKKIRRKLYRHHSDCHRSCRLHCTMDLTDYRRAPESSKLYAWSSSSLCLEWCISSWQAGSIYLCLMMELDWRDLFVYDVRFSFGKRRQEQGD